MMTKGILAGALCCLMAAGAVFAQGKPAMKSDRADSKFTKYGKVVSVNADKGMVTIKTDDGQTLALATDSKTELDIQKHAQKFDITKIQAGKDVRVHYLIKDGQKLAKWIVIDPIKKSSKKAKTASASQQ